MAVTTPEGNSLKAKEEKLTMSYCDLDYLRFEIFSCMSRKKKQKRSIHHKIRGKSAKKHDATISNQKANINVVYRFHSVHVEKLTLKMS